MPAFAAALLDDDALLNVDRPAVGRAVLAIGRRTSLAVLSDQKEPVADDLAPHLPGIALHGDLILRPLRHDGRNVGRASQLVSLFYMTAFPLVA